MRIFGEVLGAGHSMEELEATGKRARASSGILAGDRLSALPDCLLHHIMSFMKARQVVQTCVLSTRWTHLWRSVPSLDVDLDEFKTAAATATDDKEEWENFEDFTVNLMFRLNIAILDSFRLHVRRDRAPYFGDRAASSWIRRAMKYCAPDPGIQPEGLSSSPWRLKKLHLSNIKLDDRFTEHVSSRCRSLEDMELKGCSCEIREITSHSLKSLILKNCCWTRLSAITSLTLKSLVIDGVSNTYNCPLVIMAPAVAYLALMVSFFDGGVLLNGMPSLHTASIHPSELSDNQFKFLDSVSNVTSLELSDFTTMVLGEESTAFPEFQNLRTLLLDNCDLSDNFQTLGHFLQNSPNLEKLTLHYCKFSKDSKRKKGNANSKKALPSRCLNLLAVRCKNLKLTEIIYENDDVRKLVRLLLSISGNLPKNNIKLTKVD